MSELPKATKDDYRGASADVKFNVTMTTPNLEQIARETALKVHGHKSEADLKYWCSCADDVKVDDATRLILAALRSVAPQPAMEEVRRAIAAAIDATNTPPYFDQLPKWREARGELENRLMHALTPYLAAPQDSEQAPESSSSIEPMSIRSAIREGLRSKGWSQSEFADKLNVSRQYVSRILDAEIDEPNWTLGHLRDIATALDIELVVFMHCPHRAAIDAATK